MRLKCGNVCLLGKRKGEGRGKGGEGESRIIVLEGQLSPSIPFHIESLQDLFDVL